MTKHKIKTLIIDDERLARKSLSTQLEQVAEIEIVGEADDVPSAIEAINSLKPQLLFLDIQMPGQTGFDLIEQIDFDGHIIFVTAYDEYAIRAFEVNALDYLMKPIDLSRLKKAIERIETDEASLPQRTEKQNKLSYDDQLFTTIGTKVQFLKIKEIVVIHSDGDYTNLHIANKTHGLINKTMKEWEERLPEQHFVRVHRHSIININYIEKIEKWFNYSYRAKLQDIDEPVIISRRYAKKLKEIFG